MQLNSCLITWMGGLLMTADFIFNYVFTKIVFIYKTSVHNVDNLSSKRSTAIVQSLLRYIYIFVMSKINKIQSNKFK